MLNGYSLNFCYIFLVTFLSYESYFSYTANYFWRHREELIFNFYTSSEKVTHMMSCHEFVNGEIHPKILSFNPKKYWVSNLWNSLKFKILFCFAVRMSMAAFNERKNSVKHFLKDYAISSKVDEEKKNWAIICVLLHPKKIIFFLKLKLILMRFEWQFSNSSISSIFFSVDKNLKIFSLSVQQFCNLRFSFFVSRKSLHALFIFRAMRCFSLCIEKCIGLYSL